MLDLNSITLLGQSGVGKTTLSTMLQREQWYHYSADYRIATHYLMEEIEQWLKEEIRQIPLFSQLLDAHAISVTGKVEIENLALLSQYINKIGKQGIDLNIFKSRQQRFAEVEKQAMYDVAAIKSKVLAAGKYQGFINDAGGSLLEYTDDKALFDYLSQHTLFVYIDADEDLQAELMQRAIDYPKPICYHPEFLECMLREYQQIKGISDANDFDSNDFLKFVGPKLLNHRRLKALAMIKDYGVKLDAKAVWQVKNGHEFMNLLADAWQAQRS